MKMKKWVVASLAAMMALTSYGFSDTSQMVKAESTVATQAPSQDIFAPVLDAGDFKEHTHGSTIVKLHNGEMMAAWFQGNGERDGTTTRIMASRLPVGATEWTEPFVLADTPRIADINPALYMDDQERLWLFWYPVLAGRWETSQPKYLYAEKGNYEYANGHHEVPKWDWQDAIYVKLGPSFSEGVTADDPFVANLKAKLSEFEAYTFRPKADGGAGMNEIYTKDWLEFYNERVALATGEMYATKKGYPLGRRLGFQTKDKPFSFKLQDGKTRMILPLYSDNLEMSVMAITDNYGRSWTFSEPIVGMAIIQASVVRKIDGTLVAYLRDNGKPPQRVVYSESKDNGLTWTIGKDRDDLFDYGVGHDLTMLPNGNWVFVHNDIEDGRYSLSVLLSDDDGQSWKYRRHIEMDTREERGDYHYPAVITDDEGNIHITYTVDYTSADVGADGKNLKNYNNIKYLKVNEEWIKAGDVQDPADQKVYSFEKIDAVIDIDDPTFDETNIDPTTGKIAVTEMEKLKLPRDIKGYLTYLNPLRDGRTQAVPLKVNWDFTALAKDYKADAWMKKIPGRISLDDADLPDGFTKEKLEAILPEMLPQMNLYIRKMDAGTRQLKAENPVVYSYETLEVEVDGNPLDEANIDPDTNQIAISELEKLNLPTQIKAYANRTNPLSEEQAEEIVLHVTWSLTELASQFKTNEWITPITGTIDLERLPEGITADQLPPEAPWLSIYIVKKSADETAAEEDQNEGQEATEQEETTQDTDSEDSRDDGAGIAAIEEGSAL